MSRRLGQISGRIASYISAVAMVGACATPGVPTEDGRAVRGEGAVLSFELPEDDHDADVFVDGNYVGQVREVQGAVRVAPGRHRVELRKAGRFPVQKTIDVDASRREQTLQVRGELLGNPLE